MQEELKPCPFCGGKLESELAPSGYVFCQKCLARTYELGNGAATWNKRDHERIVKVLADKLRLAGKTLQRIPGASKDPLGIDAVLREARMVEEADGK